MEASEGAPGRRGFAAGADREAVVVAAAEVVRGGEVLDVQRLCESLGVGRTTVYRWFGTRAGLLGEALWVLVDRAWLHARSTSAGSGSVHVQQVISTFLVAVRDSAPAATLVTREPRLAITSIMSPTGYVQRRAVARVDQLLRERSDLPGAEVRPVAEILTQVAMTYVWAQLLTGVPSDLATPLAITDRLLREAR